MNKTEAVEKFVARDLASVPQEWVRIVSEYEGGYAPLPMWGTMWIVDSWIGEKLMERSRLMYGSVEELKDEVDQEENSNFSEDERARLTAAIAEDDWSVLEEYIQEDMAGALAIIDGKGNTIGVYIYEIADQYVLGINGAGYSFYDSVWPALYDVLGYEWHDEEVAATA